MLNNDTLCVEIIHSFHVHCEEEEQNMPSRKNYSSIAGGAGEKYEVCAEINVGVLCNKCWRRGNLIWQMKISRLTRLLFFSILSARDLYPVHRLNMEYVICIEAKV